MVFLWFSVSLPEGIWIAANPPSHSPRVSAAVYRPDPGPPTCHRAWSRRQKRATIAAFEPGVKQKNGTPPTMKAQGNVTLLNKWFNKVTVKYQTNSPTIHGFFMG